MDKKDISGRRKFFKIAALGSLGASIMSPMMIKSSIAETVIGDDEKTKTNIAEALKHPRNENSMPGKYPGKVVKIFDKNSVKENKPEQKAAENMIAKGMLQLTGAATVSEAWLQFVKPGEKIGLKLNPVAGKLLSTSHAVTKAVIKQLLEAGIKKEDLKHLFEKFFRGAEAKQRVVRGLGLGLYYVKQIVEAHGGIITVQSKPGEGTTFHIKIPTDDGPVTC